MEKTLLPSPRILSFGWGKIEVERLGQGKDFKLWPGGGKDWDWSEHGTNHSRGIQQGDVEELLKHGATIIILTTGRLRRLKVERRLMARLQTMEGVKVVVTDTRKGIELYNEYAEQQLAVGGLFHSTC